LGAVRPDPKPGPALGATTATDEGWDLSGLEGKWWQAKTCDLL